MVDKINKNKLDPITIYSTLKISVMLTREEMKVPIKNEDNDAEDDGEEQEETDEAFRERLIKVSSIV